MLFEAEAWLGRSQREKPMAARRFEEFLTLFDGLKAVAGEPKRLAAFYTESSAIREAVKKLQGFVDDFERAAFFMSARRFGRVPAGFEQAWSEYQTRWLPAISHARFCDLFHRKAEYAPENDAVLQEGERKEPDFDPRFHDGGLSLKLALDYWRSEFNFYARRANSEGPDDYGELIPNECRIAIDAFDYLTSIIGIDIYDVFRRWAGCPQSSFGRHPQKLAEWKKGP